MMKRQRRQTEIVALLGEGNFRGIGDLAAALSVSEETIRRELRVLEASGAVVRAHGAVRLAKVETEGSFATRLQRHAEAKQRIAAAVAQIVADGQTLYIDASTTGHYVARALRDHQRLTVITNAVGVAAELGGRNDNRVLLAGGELDYEYRACFDATARDYLAMFTPSLAILSVESVNLDHGFADYHAGEAAVCRMMIARARRTVIAADASKFDRHGTVQVAALDGVAMLVTDVPLSPAYAEALSAVEVVVA
ncbi:DeoR family glycerol-3-phosphate regulon repressor [Sphingomonas sp. SORGH_AS 950]|uniref:DeoR/GlpR family DNA-binding transcription regulator n=1 Tax=unclassified Sphingomonas TaxID=196159 RepID=UPI00278A58A2|nr:MULTISPECIES: DeoR/GlpR family DNA-binding transcription regulator [unclassified Sphingomonas]MDQ1157456.1 DeoR family glycerol-3-phosphate regulon repressor [Sphingomonas sp. SORGH_AS_0950]MDR6147934.1 DeoR family glycerol-3-phosphate regulon repressor [Sphingomonas sp. SORGH_AS_0870]